MRRTENLRHAVRAVVKETVWLATNHHRPGGGRDIALFASRRGGSTWLMELLAVNPGIKALDQPLEITTGTLTPGQARLMPKFHLGEIVHLDPVTEPMVRSYLACVLSGAVPVNAPVRVWRPEFHLRTNRALLKIVGAKSIAPWIDDNFPLEVIHLLRHPVPQAVSCRRNGWTPTLSAFLDADSFVAEHLGEHEGYCRDVLTRPTTLEAYVLNWVLENLVMLRAVSMRPAWLVVRYEDLVIEPRPTLEWIAERLELPAVDEMVARTSAASVSSPLSTRTRRAAMANQDGEALAHGWRDSIDVDDLAVRAASSNGSSSTPTSTTAEQARGPSLRRSLPLTGALCVEFRPPRPRSVLLRSFSVPIAPRPSALPSAPRAESPAESGSSPCPEIRDRH